MEAIVETPGTPQGSEDNRITSVAQTIAIIVETAFSAGRGEGYGKICNGFIEEHVEDKILLYLLL